MPHLVLVLHSGLRKIDEAEVLESLSQNQLALPRSVVNLDTTQFAAAVNAGDWSGQGQFLREHGELIHEMVERFRDAQIHYFGLAEIPHVLALGAALGTERRLTVHEYDRDKKAWSWPDQDPTLSPSILGKPLGPIVRTRGHAVIRVAISAEIHDEDVRTVVQDPLADVVVRIDAPSTTQVRHPADVVAIQRAFREGLASIIEHRPGVEVIHLFVAAPVSVCFAVGQELVPRNSPPIQTYRFRKTTDSPSNSTAILISPGDPEIVPIALSGEERQIATSLRQRLWPKVLNEVRRFARSFGSAADNAPWYSYLVPSDELKLAAPFQSLPPLGHLIHPKDAISPEPYHLDYGHDATRNLWLLSDRLLVNLSRPGSDDPIVRESVIRLFLFHEYVHAYHSLTKYTAANVGKFPNALERLDYTADTYAVFHELAYRVQVQDQNPQELQHAIRSQVDQLLRSFWCFDGRQPYKEMQSRRLRRYLNWYWRHAQLERTDSLIDSVLLFTRSPAVEIAGLRLRTDGERRVFSQFQQSPGQRVELAILAEDERLVRVQDSDASPMADLIDAFRRGDHAALQQWFRPVFEVVQSHGAVFPGLHPDVRTR